MRKGLVACVVTFALFAATVAAVTLVSETSTTASAAIGGRCICPMIYAPVRCDNGRTYSNSCFASCAGARNCVPIGPGPIEL